MDTNSRILAAVCLAFSSVAAASAKLTDDMPVDGFAAIVNERVITIGDVMDFLQSSDLQMRDDFAGMELQRRSEAFTAARDLLIEQALIVEEFKKSGATLPDRIVDGRIRTLIAERFGNDRSRFLAALAQEQITLEEWRERVREGIIVSLMRRQEVIERAKVSPGLLRAAYEARADRWNVPERIRVRLITLRLPESGPAAVDARRQLAVRARGRILAGESFADVAREISEDSKAAAGGDWGWRSASDFAGPLRAALEALKPGEVSDVIETPGAIHLALVEERQSARMRTFEEVRPELERELRQAEIDRIYRRWIERLRRKHVVQIF
ncbi:MAG: peptidylprolyl isomerase [Kiritimatiellae bacterium]|nr:peptidylprolyl isomerase [Kiritimatiellia bacterium]MDW8459033.1 peptidylprolyl isomerase [Verrucomicrobiota bacterium]